MCRWLFRITNLTQKVKTICSVSTLAEQRDLWYGSLRRILLSWPLHLALVSTDWWCWKAAGVPPEQRQLIVTDYESTLSPSQRQRMTKRQITGEAIFKFLEDTLDPVANHTLLSRDNYFYYLVLQGRYTKQCAPRWLGARAHRRLSHENAERLDGLRIHTDEFLEVVRRMRGGSVSAVIVMDSMDWLEIPDTFHTVKHVQFSDRRSKHESGNRNRSRSKSRSTEGTDAAQTQIDAIHLVLRVGGKVLLRSAALKPWYIDLFERMEDEDTGQKLWRVTCMGRRENGKCIDRVNMYASCWLLVKIGEGAATPGLVGSPTDRMKSALKRRRTGSGGSGASSSGSEWVHARPEVLRGRKSGVGDDGDGEETETETENDVRRKRGVLEDMMLPGAAMGGDDCERF